MIVKRATLKPLPSGLSKRLFPLLLSLGLMTLLAWVPGVPVANAGEYVLTKERVPQRPLKSFTLCKDLEESLNHFRDAPLMVCGIRVHPSVETLSVPDWEPLDPREHMDILRAIAKARDYNLPSEEREKNWRINLKAIQSGVARLWRAQIDLSNSGRDVTVLRHDLWGCSSDNELNFANGRLPGLAVLGEHRKRLDPAYKLLHKGPRQRADVFIHEGRTYISRWWGDLNFENGELAVYDSYWAQGKFGYHHRSLCEFSFKQGAEK